MKNSSMLAVLIATAMGVINCSNSTEPEQMNDTKNTSTEIPAVFKNFTSNVQISVSGDYVVLQTDDLPNHPSPYFGAGNSKYEAYNGSNPSFMLNPNRITIQSITLRIPINPKPASTPQSTSLGPIGISVNGVVFYNQYAAGFSPLTNAINTLDQYNGHPQQFGQYHYHITEEVPYLNGGQYYGIPGTVTQ